MTLYLDTSSLVKLYVTEPGSDVVRKLVDTAAVVATSAIAYMETRAARQPDVVESVRFGRPYSRRPRRRSKRSGPSILPSKLR